MQLQAVFILFLLNLSKMLTQNVVSYRQQHEADATKTDKISIDDTPSPEWIKYQKERYQNSDKLSSIVKTTQSEKLPNVAKVDLDNVEATSRKESSHYVDIEQDDFKNVNSQTSEEFSANNMNTAVEFPSIKGFIAFIKSLKQTWMKKSLFRLDDKVNMLYHLKNSLLKAIEQKFMVLWQDDEGNENHNTASAEGRGMLASKPSNHLRSKRGILGESSIYFPPDAALMSINFLTFAVFLIKLVLQVVNIVKTKHYQFSTLNMDTGAIRSE